jgi:uncharacterized protein YcfJ
MNTLKIKLVVAATLIGMASVASAGGPGRGHQGGSYQDWARVTQVQPHYERVKVARQECGPGARFGHNHHDDGRSLGGAVVGGIAGGVIGNQVGSGSGRVAATAVGAVVGAVVGDRVASAHAVPVNHPGYRGPHCRTVDHWENRLTGYNVTYEYNGRRYTRFMTQDPGRRVRVNVSVSPA